MTLPLGLTPEAKADLFEARDWYEAQRSEWGAVFDRSVEACFERSRRMPQSFRAVHGKVRRAPLRRFPHGVFYWVEDEQIVVFAIWHGRRAPRGWRARLSSQPPASSAATGKTTSSRSRATSAASSSPRPSCSCAGRRCSTSRSTTWPSSTTATPASVRIADRELLARLEALDKLSEGDRATVNAVLDTFLLERHLERLAGGGRDDEAFREAASG